MKTLLLFLALLCLSTAHAANYTAAASGNWNQASTWSPAVVPTSADNVTIPTGFTVTVTATASITGVTLSGGTLSIDPSVTLTISGATTYSAGTVSSNSTGTVAYTMAGAQNIFPGTYGSLTVSGATTSIKTAAGAFDVLGTLTYNNSSTTGKLLLNNTTTPRTFNIGNLSITTGIVDGGSVDAATGNVTSTLNVSGNITVAGTGTLTNGSASHVNALNITGAGTINVTSTATTPFQYNSVTVANGASTTLQTNWKISGITGTYLTVAQGGTLTAAGFVISTSTASGAVAINGSIKSTASTFSGTTTSTLSSSNNPTITLGSASTVEYNGSGAQTISALTYNNLTISGNHSASVNFSSGTTNITGTLQSTATFSTGSLNATTNLSTIAFTGTAAQTVPAMQYYNLTLGGTSRTGSLTLSPTGTIQVKSTLTNSATFTSGSLVNTGSTIEFNGTSTQTIAAMPYFNLKVSGTRTGNGTTVTFSSSTTIGIAGSMDMSTLAFSGNNAGYVITSTTFDYNGTGAQNLEDMTYATLRISNNTGGVNANSATVNTATIVSGKLYFVPLTNGNVYVIDGSGTFTLNSGATLGITSSNGISASGASGNIQSTGTRSFNAGANYVYMRNYTGTQSTGLGLPATITGSLQVNLGALADAALTLSQSTSAATVTLSNGTLTTGTNTLTLPGVINRDGTTQTGMITAATGTVVFNGTAAQNIPAGALSGTINTFTVNNTSGSTPALTLNDNLTVRTFNLTVGQFNIGSNQLSIAGTTNRSNGTVNATAGTVNYNGTAAQSILANMYSGAIGKLIVDNSSGAAAALAMGGNLSVSGELALTTGVFNVAGFTLSEGGDITRTAGKLDVSAGTLLFNGSSAQNVVANAFSGNVLAMTLSNGSAAGVSLNTALQLTGTLTLNTGTLNLEGGDLTVNAGSISGGSSASYVKTPGTGALLVKNVPAAGTFFPVGNSTYNPLNIANPVLLDWSVKVADAISNVTAGYAASVDRAISRQWDITPSQNSPAPGGGATISFYYDGTTDAAPSFSNAVDVQVWHYYQGFWAARGSAQTPTTANGMKSVTVTGLTYFSPYALSNVGAPLPVTLVSFTGKRVNGVNELKWMTITESNNRGFEVERSLDGTTFTKVGFVASRAQGGNSTTDISYAYSDASTVGSKWYYRLKQIDIDGRAKYSAVVLLKGDKSGVLTLDGIYPNPVQAVTNIRLQASAQGGNITLQLSDLQGRIVRTKSVAVAAGSATSVTMELQGLAAGQYHLVAVDAQGQASETVTLVKQ